MQHLECLLVGKRFLLVVAKREEIVPEEEEGKSLVVKGVANVVVGVEEVGVLLAALHV